MTFFARSSQWTRAHKDAAQATPFAGGSQYYFAFLSYSHKDSRTADWLHEALEKYRVPRALVGRQTPVGIVPAKLRPIFRDRSELAASGDLGHTIREALAGSRCLLVLCSSQAAHSRWTNEEILAFKKAHPKGRVLAAIVEGEPFASEIVGHEQEECFPPALRQKFDSRGRPTGKRAEPIAADLRDTGDGRQLGLLKIIAGMIGVGLDDLVQREQHRRHRRLTYIAAASLTGMVVTSGLAVFAFDKRDEARDQRREAEGLVGFMLGDLRDKLEPIGRLDALDAVGARALVYFEKQDKSELSDKALAQRSKALTLMGEIANTRGDLSGAMKRYREALASTEEAARRNPKDPQRLFDHAQNVYWVGYINYQRGQMSKAAAQFQLYKRLADRMVELSPSKKEYKLEQLYAETNLGTVLVAEYRFREAAKTYLSAQSVAEALAAAEPRNTAYQKQVTDNLAWLADAREFSGELDQALADRERQLGLLNDLERSDPRDTEIQRNQMTAHRAIGRLLASRGERQVALKELEQGVALADMLFRIEPQNTEWLQANAPTKFDLADVQLSLGEREEAATTVRAACDIVERLLATNDSAADWKSEFRTKCLVSRSRLALAENRAEESFALARQALNAAHASPKPIDRGILRFRSLAAGGNALAASGRGDEANAWWRAALKSVPGSIELTPREKGAIAAVKLRLGDRSGAQQLTSSLQAMGYRHPIYLEAIRAAGAKT